MKQNYKPYIYNEKALLLSKYLILSMDICYNDNYDIFELEIDQKTCELINSINDSTYINYKVHDDINYEFFNNFSNYKLLKDKKIKLFTKVVSEKENDVIICVYCPKKMKIWLNNTLIAINSESVVEFQYISTKLKKGDNVFVIELFDLNENTLFNIQIRDYLFEMSNSVFALKNVINNINVNPDLYISERNNNKNYKFMMLFNKTKNLNDKMKVSLVNIDHGIIEESIADRNKPFELDLNEIIHRFKNPITSLRIDTSYFTNDNNEIIFYNLLYFDKITQKYHEATSAITEFYSNLEFGNLKDYLEGILYVINESYKNGDMLTTSNMAAIGMDFICKLNKGLDYNEYFYTEGKHVHYYRSRLDNSLIRLNYTIPVGYNRKKKYPAFFALSTGNIGVFCMGLREESLNEPVLTFDISGRGYTGGSYIGEASILEIVDWIEEYFNIDEDRLYILGTSNGGYASWAFAQNYPHKPAAIYPLIGCPDIKSLTNTSNIPIYQFVSSDDHVFRGRENEVYNVLKNHGKYFQYNCQMMLHNHFNVYVYHPLILNSLLKHKRNKFPQRIIFTTFRNRHNESFWIKIHGIKRGHNRAKINAFIENKNRINITTSGINGFTITIPPMINKNEFIVSINRKEYIFKNIEDDTLILVKNNKWEISNEEKKYDFQIGRASCRERVLVKV